MGPFEYVMTLVSIVVGLALTHVLSALGSAVHRLRHGPPIRLDAVYLLWVGFVLAWLLSCWWWEFKFHDLDIKWTFGLYLFVILYAIVLFLMAVILVPKDMEGVHDSYAYFMAGRRWFFGSLFLANAVDVFDSLFKGTSWALRPGYIVQVALYIAAAVAGIVSNRRSVQLGIAVVMFAMQVLYTWEELDILGAW
jgi:hypothetical protein